MPTSAQRHSERIYVMCVSAPAYALALLRISVLRKSSRCRLRTQT